MRIEASFLLLTLAACSGQSTIGTPGGPGLGARCGSTAECGGRTPMCVDGSCVECTAAADCGGEPCVNGLCDVCASNSDCGGGNPFCVLGRCRECREATDCGAGEVCAPPGECGPPCTDSTMCDGDRPMCLAEQMVCVECATNADCPAGDPFCLDGGRCRECRTFEDCGAGSPFCVSGECRECVQNTDCAAGQLCTSDLECEGDGGCTTDADCGGEGFCDPATMRCEQCVTDAHCAGDPEQPFCVMTECAACREAADCPVEQPICDEGQCRN